MMGCAVMLTTFVVALADMNPSNRTQTLIFLFFGTTAAGKHSAPNFGCSCTFDTKLRPFAGYIETLALSAVALVFDADDIGLVNGVLGSLNCYESSRSQLALHGGTVRVRWP